MIDEMSAVKHAKDFDHRSLRTGSDGEIDLILNAEQPAGYAKTGLNAPQVDALVVRYRMLDWINERDPQLSVECLNPVPLKPRMSAEEIVKRIPQMAAFPSRYNKIFYSIQNRVKAEVGTNVFVHHQYAAGLSQQIYWPAVFELDDGEASLIETEMPTRWSYWNIQLNDPIYNAVEYVYRMSSLNEASSIMSSDGKFLPAGPGNTQLAGIPQDTRRVRSMDGGMTAIPTACPPSNASHYLSCAITRRPIPRRYHQTNEESSCGLESAPVSAGAAGSLCQMAHVEGKNTSLPR